MRSMAAESMQAREEAQGESSTEWDANNLQEGTILPKGFMNADENSDAGDNESQNTEDEDHEHQGEQRERSGMKM